jgi:histidyl-tRNA synthetase
MPTPSGTIDLHNNDVSIRNYIFNCASAILKKRCAHQIDTPVIELMSTVNTLYGGDFNKLVYSLNDGNTTNLNNNLLLRYDLTVPFARYIGDYGLDKFKRFQYGKVYRRDTPQLNKGRYREFFQLDYDIAGNDQGSHVNDLEMLETLSELLDTIIGKTKYTVKINHKDIVVNMLNELGIPEDNHPDVFIAIDKLDKKPFSDITEELSKHISQCCIDKLENKYNLFASNPDNLTDLMNLPENNYITTIFSVLKRLNIDNYIFDPFLIRGMQYYTGIIYEVVYNDKDVISSSIAAGGRYDDMIETFSNKGNIPAIGLSLGVDRIVKIIEHQQNLPISITENIPQIYVASVGKNMEIERSILCAELRRMNYSVITSDLPNPNMKDQLVHVLTKYSNVIPVMIIIGGNEIQNNVISIKNINVNKQIVVNRVNEQMREVIDNILQQ